MSLIKIRRSAVPNKVPTTSQLGLGELALNTFDGALYTKKDNGSESIIDLTRIPTLDEVTSQNNITTNTIRTPAVEFDHTISFDTTYTAATLTEVNILTLDKTVFESGKILIQATEISTGHKQISELLISHNGTTAIGTEFAIITTNSLLATYDVDIVVNQIVLKSAGQTANSIQYKIYSTLFKA